MATVQVFTRDRSRPLNSAGRVGLREFSYANNTDLTMDVYIDNYTRLGRRDVTRINSETRAGGYFPCKNLTSRIDALDR